MDRRVRFPTRFLVTVAAVLVTMAGLVVFTGCKDKAEVQQTATPPVQAKDATVAAVTVQETCPIMGNPINKEIFVEYQGKKVYFCCNGCSEKFLADPEKYVAKLPQFQE